MKCGHACEKLCHVYNCNDKKCLKPCAKQYSPCNHPCKKLCYENCEQCQELVDKKLKCGHIQKNVICSEEPNSCREIVNKNLPCGHIYHQVCLYKYFKIQNNKICPFCKAKERSRSIFHPDYRSRTSPNSQRSAEGSYSERLHQEVTHRSPCGKKSRRRI